MRELINSYDPLLKQPCEPFVFEEGIHGLNAVGLFELLKESMIKFRGLGLSACQIGILTRVFVIGDPDTPESIIPVFNPRIVNYSNEEAIMEEGCLSFPGLFVKVKRPSSVRARFANINGEVDVANFTGFTARVFQHEYDHMDGILFTKRARRLDLDKAYTQQKKLNRERKRNAAAVLRSLRKDVSSG